MLTAISLPTTEKLQRHITAYTTLCLEVGLGTVNALMSLGESFSLLIFSEDAFSQHYLVVLERFLKYQPMFGPILAISVKLHGSSQRSEQLGVCRVPQLRRYVGGKEVRRLVGTADYDQLLNFFGGVR